MLLTFVEFLMSLYCDIIMAQFFDGSFDCDVIMKKSAIRCDLRPLPFVSPLPKCQFASVNC